MSIRILTISILIAAASMCSAQNSYVGFDKNTYPGDDLLPALHKSFAYSGYWLNNPPGATSNPWQGKRAVLAASGFGFLVLFNGRLDSEFKKSDPAPLGRSDAAAAIAAAQREGFPNHTIIFLDIEEGGRLLPEHLAYVLAWSDAVRRSGYRPGVYCSGIPVPDGPGKTITTADHIHTHDNSIALFIYHDVCPPSPGCVSDKPPALSNSGTKDALVWQYAQSPRRPEFTNRCAKTYSLDRNCYATGVPKSAETFIDLDVSSSPDPSAGR
jgi:hypothetical protein